MCVCSFYGRAPTNVTFARIFIQVSIWITISSCSNYLLLTIQIQIFLTFIIFNLADARRLQTGGTSDAPLGGETIVPISTGDVDVLGVVVSLTEKCTQRKLFQHVKFLIHDHSLMLDSLIFTIFKLVGTRSSIVQKHCFY